MEDRKGHVAPYLEVAVGNVQNRNRIIHYSELPKIVQENPDKEVYRSYYWYDESRVKHGGSAKEYLGKRYVRDIHFDFDGEEALEHTRQCVEQLKGLGVPEGYIWVWFSGNKGFHVWVPDVFGFTPGHLVHEDVRVTLKELSPHIDTAPCSINGLIRAEWSYHAKSGMYKVLLDNEFEPKYLNYPQVYAANITSGIHLLDEYDSTPLSDLKIENLSKEISPEDMPRKSVSTNYMGCMSRLWNRGPVEGRRHRDILRLATSFRHRGLTAEMTLELLLFWVQPTNMETKKVHKVVKWVYETARHHHSCDTDRVMVEFCIGNNCPLYKHRHNETVAEPMDEAMEKYRIAAMKDLKGFDLGVVYPGVRYMMLNGEYAIVLADTKIGKTSMVLGWAIADDESDNRWLFITPEMNTNAMVERSLQIAHSLRVNERENINEVRELAISGNGSYDAMLEKVKHITWVTTPPYLENLGRVIDEHEANIVVIDPLEMIYMKDSNANDIVLANGIREIANKKGVVIICIHHINKEGQKEGGSTKIQAWMGKGYKRFVEQADHVFVLEGIPDSVHRRLARDRGRRYQDLDISLIGDKETFQFKKA